MDLALTVDIPTIMGFISLIFFVVLAFMNRLAVDVAAVLCLVAIGLIFAS